MRDGTIDLRISVRGSTGSDGPDSLVDWLRSDTRLRGRVTIVAAPPLPGTMSVGTEVVVALTSTGSVAVLAGCLRTWLVQRRCDVSVKIEEPGGRDVVIDVRRAPDAEAILGRILALLPDDPPEPEGRG
ncbi:MAG: hypothetical protein QG608_188 [Actinomycetota bacterium]|nr:hypothetical protein [Actinomycetota bacterium]